MKTAASIAFGIVTVIGVSSAGIAVASIIHDQSEVSSMKQIDSDTLWTSKPERIDVADQSLERLPPRYSTYVTEPNSLKVASDSNRFVVFADYSGMDDKAEKARPEQQSAALAGKANRVGQAKTLSANPTAVEIAIAE